MGKSFINGPWLHSCDKLLVYPVGAFPAAAWDRRNIDNFPSNGWEPAGGRWKCVGSGMVPSGYVNIAIENDNL